VHDSAKVELKMNTAVPVRALVPSEAVLQTQRFMASQSAWN